MPKNLDGIKKLSPEELKKSREIVLDYIGEKEVKSKAQPDIEKKSAEPIKKVDGVRLNPKAEMNKPEVSQPKKRIEAVKEADVKKSEVNQAELEKIKAEAEKEKLKTAIKRQAEERKKFLEEEKRLKRNKIEEEKQKKQLIIQKIKQEEERKRRLEAEQKRHAEEKLRQEKEKALREETLRMEAEERERELIIRQERGKRRIKRAKKIKKFKKELKRKLIGGYNSVLAKKKILIYGSLFLIVIFVGGYFIFGLMLIYFRIDNSFSRKIVAYLPVPALITNIGMVGFYDYKDTVDQLTKGAIANNQIKQIAKKNLIKNLVYNQLAKKYNLDLKANQAEKKLADKVILDRQINQTAIYRAEKIYSLLSPDNDFEKVKIYADEYSASSNFNYEAALENFGQDINNLSVGQLSYIIPASQGYYIIRINNESDNNLNLTYLFVKAETLDDYINQQLAKIKVFSLVDR